MTRAVHYEQTRLAVRDMGVGDVMVTVRSGGLGPVVEGSALIILAPWSSSGELVGLSVGDWDGAGLDSDVFVSNWAAA